MMNGKETRAHIAGWLDGATTLTRTVIEALKEAEQMKDPNGVNKVACPPAVYSELMQAESHLARVASWLLDNSFKLD